MSYEVRVVHPGGGTTTVPNIRHEIEEGLGLKSKAFLSISRRDADSITFQEGEDEVYLEDSNNNDIFGGLLGDVKAQDTGNQSIVTLLTNSFEQFARDAEPFGRAKSYSRVTDDTIINDAIDRVPQLTAGTVSQETTGLSFKFHHASPARVIRETEASGDGEVKYNADKTVDYTSRLGTDRSSSITLSPQNQNLIDPTVNKKGEANKVTHLKVLGGSRGSQQIVTEPLNPDDSTDALVADSYSSGDRKKWDTIIFKENRSVDVLRKKGSDALADLNSVSIEASGMVRDVTVNLGDEFNVDYPEKDISGETLRAVAVTTIRDEKGERFEVTLSNQSTPAKQQLDSMAADVERYVRSAGSFKGVDRLSLIAERRGQRYG